MRQPGFFPDAVCNQVVSAMTFDQALGAIMAGAVATFVSTIVAACLYVAASSAWRREWRSAAGALLFAALLSTVAADLWTGVATGDFHASPDYDAAKLH